MKIRTHLITMLVFVVTHSIISQEKIGNKVYLYGNLKGSVIGNTLVSYNVNDPKSEIKIMNRFKEMGINTISWNKIFIPNYKYSEAEHISELNKNEIGTIIIIKPNGTKYTSQSTYNTSYNSYTNSLNTFGGSSKKLSGMGLVFEIYNRSDNFNKPRAVINANADNFWGNGYSGLTLRVVDKVLDTFEKNEAFDPKGYFAAIDSNYEKALKENPENVDALFRRALDSSNKGEEKAAITDYDEIIKLKNKSTPTIFKMSTVYNNKAYCLIKLGEYQQALPLANKAIELDKSEAYIWDTRGELYYKIGQYQNCIDDMSNAIIIKKNENSLYFRGLAKIKLEQKTEGCEDLNKSLELGKKEALLEIGKYCKN